MVELQEKVYLTDIAGYDNIKKEAQKIIDMFKNYSVFSEYGATIPKGLILSGDPGVGKTMFAKAIATESNVPLFFLDSEYDDEKSTKKAIKDIFKEAKKHIPSIIFVDEIDRIVPMRMGFVSDETIGSLKTLLTEIDGLNSSTGVMVIATANAYEELPEALKRSGRMDKKIDFVLPNLETRKKILDLYLSKTDKFKNIDSLAIAKKTSRMSGADLKNIVNNVLINSITSNNIDNITNKDFDEPINEVNFEGVRHEDTKITPIGVCYHEAGHAIASYFLNDQLGKLSTHSYRETRGFFEIEEMEEMERIDKFEGISFNNLKNTCIIALSGLASEKVMADDYSLGSMDDISKAKALVKRFMKIGAFGMKFVNLSISRMEPSESQGLRNEAEVLIGKYLDEVMTETMSLIESKKELINMVAYRLQEEKELSKETLKEIINSFSETPLDVAKTNDKLIFASSTE